MIYEWRDGEFRLEPAPHKLDYKIYCDESCHLEHDGSNVMVFGALQCSADSVESVVRSIKELRDRHHYRTEIKWTKLLSKQIPFYIDLLDLFIRCDDIRFKATIVQNKQHLDHTQYNQGSHGVFYYKVAYYTLRDFLKPTEATRIHLDYMDTQGKTRARKLLEILTTSRTSGVLSVQIVRSHESQLIQLCDLIIGAISYAKRFPKEHRSPIKGKLIEHLEGRLGRSLTEGTAPWAEKMNIFVFSPRRGENGAAN